MVEVNRSNNEYTHQKMGVIYVDFDGTICHFKFPEMGDPLPRVREALTAIRNIGYKIIVHSCRTGHYWQHVFPEQSPTQQLELMCQYLREHEIPYDDICLLDKPVADYYIDDRAISFVGDWDKALGDLIKRIHGTV